MAKINIEYVIVSDGGNGQKKFLELFSQNWSIMFMHPTANAVHYIMRSPEQEKTIYTPAVGDRVIIPTDLLKGKK